MSDDTKPNEELEALKEENKFQKDQLAKLAEKIEKLEAASKQSAESEEKAEDEQVVSKEMPDEVKKQIADALEKAAKAEEAFAKLKDEQLEKDHIAKAAVFKNLSQKPEEFGPILKRISTNKCTEEDFQKLLSVLIAANDSVEKALLSERGSSTAIESEAITKLDTLAKARAQEKGISYHIAYDQVMKENPGLYLQYKSEQN